MAAGKGRQSYVSGLWRKNYIHDALGFTVPQRVVLFSRDLSPAAEGGRQGMKVVAPYHPHSAWRSSRPLPTLAGALPGPFRSCLATTM